MSKIGKYLKEKRIESGVTQRQISEELGLTSPQYVSNIERGLCNPSLFYLYDWAMEIDADEETMIKLLVDDYEETIRKKISKGY